MREERDEALKRRATAELAKLFSLYGLGTDAAKTEATGAIDGAIQAVLAKPIGQLGRV